MKLVLFDVDGTLVQTKGVGVLAFARTLESLFGFADLTARVRFGGRTDFSLIRELFGHAGIEPTVERIRHFCDSYVFWLAHLLQERGVGGACPGVPGLLEALRELPDPPCLGLLTGNILLGAEIKLRHYGLWGSFEVGAFGDDHEDRNRIAAVARDRGSAYLGRPLAGEEVLVVGDTPLDIACGRAIGARVLAVATGGSTESELERHDPDWLLGTLAEADLLEICGR